MLAPDDPDFELAADIDRLVQTRPSVALSETKVWVDRNPADDRVAALGWCAAARALFELGRLDAAVQAARVAAEASVRHGDAAVMTAVTMSEAAILAESGLVDEALGVLDGLGHDLTLQELGRLQVQRAYVLHHAGDLVAALECVDRGEALLRKANDEHGLVRLLQNRGLVRLQQGRLDVAETDFQAAERLAEELGLTAMRALTMGNLGVLCGRSRRMRDSARYFQRAAELFESSGEPARMVAIVEIDRAEVFMHAGLVADALRFAAAAVRRVEPTGNRVVLGDAQLVLARVQLSAGRYRSAEHTAAAAARTFESTGRPRMATQAHAVAMQARLERGPVAEATPGWTADDDVIDAVVRDGWDRVADELRVARLRASRRQGNMGDLIDDLQHLRLGVFSGRRDTALSGWYAEALARRLAGDTMGAAEASKCGLDLLDDIVSEAPTLGERSAAMRLGNDLSELTIELAVERGDAGTVFAAAEGTRARALHEELADQRRHRPLTEEGADDLRRELAARLGRRVLVEWLVVGDVVLAVVFGAAGSRLIEVCAAADLRRARDRVLVSLDLAAVEPDASSARAVRAAAALDDLLMEPLRLEPDAGVIMVPVGLLHGIPWSGLPSLVA